MATRLYRWREAMGDPYDPSDYYNQDDCGYCGAPPMYQDAKWTDDLVAEENQCPSCGATGLYPLAAIENDRKKEERKTMITEQRINAVANVLIQAAEVFINPGLESERGLLDAARGLDRDGASVLTSMAKGLLTFSGSEETEDAKEE
jgi:hypothetical protein